jgi:hypothetical protein
MNFKKDQPLDLNYYPDLIKYRNECNWYMIIEYMSDSNIRWDILVQIWIQKDEFLKWWHEELLQPQKENLYSFFGIPKEYLK